MILLRIDERDSKNLLISKLIDFYTCVYLCVFLFVIECRVAGHPLAQNERSLHVFLQEEKIDRDNYVPGKVRHG